MSAILKLAAFAEATQASPSAHATFPASAESLFTRWNADPAAGRRDPPVPDVSDSLTARERDVLVMMSRGCSNKHIARIFGISPETVKSHAKHIFSKLAVCTRTEAVFRAGALGLL